MIATAMQPWVWGRVHVGIACDVASVGPGGRFVFIVHGILGRRVSARVRCLLGASWRCGSCCPRCLKAVGHCWGRRATTDAIAVHEVTASLPTPVKPRGLPPREGVSHAPIPIQVEDVSAGIDPQRVAQLRTELEAMKDVAVPLVAESPADGTCGDAASRPLAAG